MRWIHSFALLVVLAACGAPPTTEARRAAPAEQPVRAPETFKVTYQVTSDSNGLSLTYSDATGDTAQAKVNAYEGWTREQTMRRGAFAYVSAQMTLGFGTKVTCRILVDGVLVKENTSTGQFSIVTCSGRL